MKKLMIWLCVASMLALLPLTALADRQYLLDSDTRRITEAELWDWDRESLSFMFNEIFARHGFTFDVGGKFYNWFNSQPWYQSTRKVDDQTAYNKTTSLEWDNYHTIKKVIAQMEAVGHPYRKTRNSNLKSWTDFTPPGNWSLSGFAYATFQANQKLEVYSAPSASSWRGANGKASVSTNGAVWAAGWENGWLQIFYETNNGAIRVGYVNGSKIKGKTDAYGYLNFAYTAARTTAKCTLTDDPIKQNTTIAALPSGASVTYLSTAVNQYGQAWDYVETTIGGQTARGYITAGCLDLPQDTVPEGDYGMK